MANHELLKKVCIGFDKYIKDKKKYNEILDCSCGCVHFHTLEGSEGFDWGICTNPKSKRAGKLTFEHMVKFCKYFKRS